VTVRVDDLPPCSACGGKVFPLVLCESCGAVTIFRDVRSLGWTAPCSECGALNSWELICDQCRTQFPAPGRPEGQLTKSSPAQTSVEIGAVPVGRPRRKIKGEVDSRALTDLLKVLGLDASRARALIERGYDAPWKIARAKEDQLARIPEVGPIAARKMVASFHLLNYAPPKQTKESIAQAEYECPLCQCVTSAFSSTCVECGAPFDEEEMEEDIRHAFAAEGPAAIRLFYDGCLAEKPDDAELWYARGLLLESLGQSEEAIASLERASSKAPDSKKIKVARLRLQAKHLQRPEDAAKLRSTASSLLDDVAWDQEVAQLDRVISEAERECPQCGATVPAEMAMCPSCGARLSIPKRAPPPKKQEPSPTPELDALVDDLLVGELEQSLSEDELEKTKAAVLDWLILELEESMAPDTQVVHPPEKGEAKATGEEKLPPVPSPLSESIGFLSQWVRGSRGLVSGLRPKHGPRGSGKVNGIVNGKGRVNGLVNGVGRTNGLVNGVGRTNGLVNGMGRVNGLTTPAGRVNGLVTGRGRVNGLMTGTGRVNGIVTSASFGRPTNRGLRLPYPSRRVRYLTIASGILVAILIAGLLFIPPSGPSAPIAIDGSFEDWASVPMFMAATVASDKNVSISRYASLLDHESLYLFGSMRGDTFGDPVDYNGIYFLIDGDGNASTGFQFNGVGADAVVEVFGSGHIVDGARLYSFPVASEVNWSQRQSSGSAQAASSARGVEVRVSTTEIDRFNKASFRISVYADDFKGASSRSRAMLNAANAAILLEPRPLTTLVGSGPTNLFQIQVQALGITSSSNWVLTNITRISTSGLLVSLSPESVTLTQGQPNATITASVSAPGFFPGDIVQVDVTDARAPVPVIVHGAPVLAYVLTPPSMVRIDGLFADWVGNDHLDSDPARVNNSNVDIVRYGATVDASTAYFHVAVAGNVLAGRIPERFARSLSGPGGNVSVKPVPLPRITGEDILRVYIDLNASDSRGESMGGIRADYLFELRGENGRITGRALFTWNGSWRPIPLPVTLVAKNDTDIEGSLAIGPTTNLTRMVFTTTDWSGIADFTLPVNATVQAPAPVASQYYPIINAPEFHEVAIPVVGTLLILLGFARRRRRTH
jgi:tetratricopeptide (TPR) repeat protein